MKRAKKGFTLIELIVVIAVIIALAGIVFASFIVVNQASARKKAEVQMAALETALGEYQFDNSGYPASAHADSEDGAGVLYQALSGNGDNLIGGSKPSLENPKATDLNKVYLNDLLPGSDGLQGWVDLEGTQLSIVDPWGNPWHYVSGDSTGNQNNVEYDLWSQGPDNSPSEQTWISNWK